MSEWITAIPPGVRLQVACALVLLGPALLVMVTSMWDDFGPGGPRGFA